MQKSAVYFVLAVGVASILSSIAQAGQYDSRVTSRLTTDSRINSYSQFKMDGYNFRSHSSLNRLNYKRHFTLNRVYDRDRNSYRALRKLEK